MTLHTLDQEFVTHKYDFVTLCFVKCVLWITFLGGFSSSILNIYNEITLLRSAQRSINHLIVIILLSLYLESCVIAEAFAISVLLEFSSPLAI